MIVPLGGLLDSERIMAFPRPIHFNHSFPAISSIIHRLRDGAPLIHQSMRCTDPCVLTKHMLQRRDMSGLETLEQKGF